MLIIPLHTNEIPLQKSVLTCAPYTTLLKNVKKIKKGVGLGGFWEVSVTRVREGRERGKGCSLSNCLLLCEGHARIPQICPL